LAVAAERIVDGAILHILRMWLKAPVVGEDEDGTRRNIGGGKANTQGTLKGGVISPLPANLWLHLLDRLWKRQHLQRRLEARLVRYADDCAPRRKGNEQPMAVIRWVLDRLGLRLNWERCQESGKTSKGTRKGAAGDAAAPWNFVVGCTGIEPAT
jgi:RNA-directed DNA polymerase